MPLTVGVDALNLAADRRGMGRYARGVLREWATDDSLAVALLARDTAQVDALRAEFAFDAIALRDARRIPFDAVWYPWNGMRFEPRARSVVTMHDAFAFTYPHRNVIARRKEQTPILRAARRADAVTTVSHWSARELARALRIPEERFTVINPVCDAFWKPVPVEPSATPYVLFVAGPDERKNARTLFEAFARAFPNRDVALIVAGSVRDADEALLAHATFRFVRVRPDDEKLRALYSGALAVAIPSVAEGYGIMAVEAMACGAPVIAADAAALPEACDGAAQLVPATDADAWAIALRGIAGDAALRQRLRANGLTRVSRIDRGAPARRLLEVLRDA